MWKNITKYSILYSVMHMRTFLLTALMMACSVSAMAYTMNRYDVIIDRKPFGVPPVIVKPTPPKPPEIDEKTVRLCSIVDVEGAGIKVGFVNLKTKKAFSLLVGEKNEGTGIELVSADYAAKEATLRKNDELVLVKMSSGQFTQLDAVQEENNSQRSNRRMGYLERKKAREEQRNKIAQPVESKFKTREELTQHLQDYNMGLIRAQASGEDAPPPLPIPLTPEQDEQLVQEGVLPPLE